MDTEGALTVATGTLVISGFGVTYGALHAFRKGQPVAFSAVAAGVNSGLAGLIFFGIREYIVSPVLVNSVPWRQYELRREVLFGKPSKFASVPPSQSELRAGRILDSALAGAFAGGILNALRRKRGRVWRGTLLLSSIAAVGQLCANEIHIARIKFVRERRSPTSPAVAFPQVDSPKSASQSFLDALTSLGTVEKLSNEEYLATLEKELGTVDRRLQDLRDELDSLKARPDGTARDG